MECKKIENLKSCPCTYPDCSRKGICCECLRHHLNFKELPACYFSEEAEKTYDRSFEKFIKEFVSENKPKA
ncbi:MAG: cytosolic protein [Parcubacteria group bacterium CG11_big_fil_rev_8_21_14_0_20_39_14]|nr:MAG: cytosolic protein [Parcubacteria group bacterium CG11_big_fil_rev_8_21_14_0_20_39_14]PIS35334.1 MAG: cytosolic protein [Parcubacteria group bacterium CG08_land_8_20_14_0_20_38_56]